MSVFRCSSWGCCLSAQATACATADGVVRYSHRKKRQKNRAKKLRQKAKRTAASATAAAGHTEEQDSEQDPSTSGNEASTPEDAQTANSDTDAGAQRLVLGHWNTRTLAHDLRAMLVWGGVDFEDRRYEVGPPPRYDKSEWTDAKEDLGLAFPNLPFLLDRAEDVAITQHQTILRYLARKLRLEGQGDAAAMADMASEATRAWLDAFFSLTYSSYLDYSNSKKQYLIETLPYHATRFEAILLRQEQATDGHTAPVAFLCGSDEGALTYADFFLFEVLEQHRLWSDSCLDKFPARTSTSRRCSKLFQSFLLAAIISVSAAAGGERSPTVCAADGAAVAREMLAGGPTRRLHAAPQQVLTVLQI